MLQTQVCNSAHSSGSTLHPRLPLQHRLPARVRPCCKAASAPDSTSAEALAKQVEQLRAENEALRRELAKFKGAAGLGKVLASVPGSTKAASAAAPASKAAAVAIGPGAFLKQLEAGVQWPLPGSRFWETAPRVAPMPVDVGEGNAAVPPKDARQLHIVHVTAELAPIAKVGGLGDVVTGLARTCQARGHQVSVLLPFYECLPHEALEGLRHEMDIQVPKGMVWDGHMQETSLATSVWQARVAGVTVYLIRPADWNACGLFRGTRIYGGSYNELEAYLYFCRASLEFLRASNMQPHILHVHEWQACAAAMLYWEAYHGAGLWKPRVVLTIHNIDNTGECRQDEFAFTGLPGEPFATIERALDERTIGHNPERLNLMKGGIVYSNAVTTVSPTYAHEVLSGGAAGWLRSTLARPEVKSKVRGILNGIDTAEWDPASDAHLPANFSVQFPDGKALCKRFVQRGLGLSEDASKPLVVVITRLVPQKGIHLIRSALYRTLQKGGQFVLLGSGHSDGEFKALAAGEFKDHPDARLLIMYSEALAHQLYAASDMVLVPSMFEPCGLTQMIGMRYGSVPVVRKTGGLADTVRDVDAFPLGEANGYTFEGTDEGSLYSALDRAIEHYTQRPDTWRQLSMANMNAEVSWNRSAADYINLYSTLAPP